MISKILSLSVVALLQIGVARSIPSRPVRAGDRVVDDCKAKSGTFEICIVAGPKEDGSILMSNFPSQLRLDALERRFDSIDSEMLFKLTLYVVAWYFLTVTYNIAHKVVMHDIPLPLTVAAFELAVGVPVFLPAWQLKMPKIDLEKWNIKYGSIATAHGLSTILSAVSLHLDRQNMTWHYVSQALEPLLALGLTLSGLDKSWRDAPLGVTISLVIIVLGMLITCPLMLSRGSWGAFIISLAGAALGQARAVLGYLTMSANDKNGRSGDATQQQQQQAALPRTQTQPEGPALSVSNVVRVTTLLAALMALPLAVAVEGYRWGSVWRDLSLQTHGPNIDPQLLLANLVVAGVAYFFVQETSFHILRMVSPPSLAVVASARRILVVFAALFLKIPMEIRPEVIIGTTISLLGVGSYLLASQSQRAAKILM